MQEAEPCRATTGIPPAAAKAAKEAKEAAKAKERGAKDLLPEAAVAKTRGQRVGTCLSQGRANMVKVVGSRTMTACFPRPAPRKASRREESHHRPRRAPSNNSSGPNKTSTQDEEERKVRRVRKEKEKEKEKAQARRAKKRTQSLGE